MTTPTNLSQRVHFAAHSGTRGMRIEVPKPRAPGQAEPTHATTTVYVSAERLAELLPLVDNNISVLRDLAKYSATRARQRHGFTWSDCVLLTLERVLSRGFAQYLTAATPEAQAALDNNSAWDSILGDEPTPAEAQRAATSAARKLRTKEAGYCYKQIRVFKAGTGGKAVTTITLDPAEHIRLVHKVGSIRLVSGGLRELSKTLVSDGSNWSQQLVSAFKEQIKPASKRD